MADFQLVTKGHRLCAKSRNTTRVKLPVPTNDKECFLNEDVLCSRIVQRKNEIGSSSCITSIKTMFDGYDYSKTYKIVCYGIGKVSENVTAQYQLAFLILLKEMLLSNVNQALLYDPVLSSHEISVIEKLGLINIGHNEYCRHTVDVSTLFYMPHCGLSMYNNLLYANWDPQQLSNIVIVGNSFSNYFTRLTDKDLASKAFYLMQLKDSFIERIVPQIVNHSNIFNDTSVHMFVLSTLKALPTSVWSQRIEPPLDPNDEEMKFNS